MKRLTLKYSPHCGRDYYHPACDTSKKILGMMRSGRYKRAAFLEKDLQTLREIGFKVEILKRVETYQSDLS